MKSLNEFMRLVELKRELKGWTQIELAHKAKVSQASISRGKKGSQANPSLITIIRLAKVVGISIICIIHPIDRLICDELQTLEEIDKLTMLRMLYRLRNGARETDRRMKQILKEIEVSPKQLPAE